MIAWVLRAVLAALVVWSMAVVLAVQQGAHPAWAWLLAVPAVLLVTVFAIEGLWLHHRNRADPAPRATGLQVVQALVGEMRVSLPLFLWRMVVVGPGPIVHLDPVRHRGRTPLLLVHGYCCNAGFWHAWQEQLRRDDRPHMAVTLEPAFGSIDDMVPAINEALRDLVQATGCAAVVCAHSMGGLATRAWWRQAGADESGWVRHLVTLGSPHQGTATARWAHTPNGRQMREANPWLQQLARAEPATRSAQATCFYSHCDNIVFPASLATWPGADNRHLIAMAHIAMIEHPDCWAEVMHQLDLEPTAAGPSAAG